MLLKNEIGDTGMHSILISCSPYFPNYAHLLNMRNFFPFVYIKAVSPSA